jgi:hypothetical protein
MGRRRPCRSPWTRGRLPAKLSTIDNRPLLITPLHTGGQREDTESPSTTRPERYNAGENLSSGHLNKPCLINSLEAKGKESAGISDNPYTVRPDSIAPVLSEN